MPETPDFEQLAQRMADALYVTDADGTRPRTDIEPIILTRDWYAEQLRLVWNARGAADLSTIETSLASQMGPTAAGPYVKNLDRELRKLDR